MTQDWEGWVRVVSGSPPLAHLARQSDRQGLVLCHRGQDHPTELVHAVLRPYESTSVPVCPDCQMAAS